MQDKKFSNDIEIVNDFYEESNSFRIKFLKINKNLKILITMQQEFEKKLGGIFKFNCELIEQFVKNKHSITVIFNDNGASYFKEHFISPSESTNIIFDKDDAKEIYDMLTEHLKWSPEALAAGTAHENLKAASNNFSRAGGGGGAGAGNESSGNESSGNERKLRKTRKSRK